MLRNTLAEEASHPLFVVVGAEVPCSLTFDRPGQADQAIFDDRNWKTVQMSLKRKLGVEIASLMIDVGPAFLGVEVVT
jgi:hypothetical protein